MTLTLTVLRVSSVERTTAGTSDPVLKNLVTAALNQVKDNVKHSYYNLLHTDECGFRVLGYPDIRIPGYFGHRLIRTCRSKVLER